MVFRVVRQQLQKVNTMRVPVLKNDLNSSYNKVAKYIGRHWPVEKMGLGKSRESLAVLFGYNSLHEVHKSVNSTSLPEHIELSKVYKSMVGKALYHFGIRPDVLMPVLQRSPLKEMAFYKVTDVEKQRIANEAHKGKGGFLLIYDEMGLSYSYKSPELILNQHKQNLIPTYSYVVRQDGFIFSASTYESLINQLGTLDDIKELVAELGDELSVDDFISQYVSPKAWLPLDLFLTLGWRIDKGTHTGMWPAPFMVDIYFIRQNGEQLGYIVKHRGYNAFYPVLCESAEDVLSLLKKIYLNLPIQANALPSGRVELKWSLDPQPEQSGAYNQTSLDSGVITLDGQHFVRDIELKPYPELHSNSVLKAFKWEGEVSTSDINAQHALIKKSLCSTVKLMDFFANLTSEKCSVIFDMCFHNKPYAVDWSDVNEVESQKWLYIGSQVATYHPELVAHFDVNTLGYLFCHYEDDVNGNRHVWCCKKRDIGLVGYALSKSSIFTGGGINPSDDVVAALFVLFYYVDKLSKISLDSLRTNFNQIVAMLNRYQKQKKTIEDMEKWTAHQLSVDKKYLSHGAPVEHTESSLIEKLQDLSQMASFQGTS